ncbi:MAG: hypothetical protein ABEJ66_00665 [Candidatus Nanohaloarchaea archaeon]
MDEQLYRHFSQIIENCYEKTLDFQGYASEVERACQSQDRSYLLKALEATEERAEEMSEARQKLDEVVRCLESEEADTLEEFLDSSGKAAAGRIAVDGLEGEPDEQQRAAIHALKDNYRRLEHIEQVQVPAYVKAETGSV